MSVQKKRGWIFPAIAGAILAMTLTGLGWQQTSIDQTHGEHEAQEHELEETLEALLAQQARAGEIASAVDAGAPSADPELALERVHADTETIEQLLTLVFEWDSHDSYERARQDVASVYGMPEDGAFLTSFLAPDPYSEDANGVEYPYIDAAGLSSSLGGYDITPTAVRGTEYSYLVFVTAISSSTDGSTDASRSSVLEVTTDAAGDVISLSASAAPTPSRSSR